MKKTSTEFTFFMKSGVVRALTATAFFLFLGAISFAQQSGAREQIGDLSHLSWKSPSGIDATVQAEISRMDEVLSQPDVQEQDRALFQSYKRMVNYIHQGIQGGKSVGEAIYESYEKVLAEALIDPELKQMPEGTLMNLMPTLVESFIVVPVPETFQGQ
jgi:hypothetical protein